MEHMFKKDSPTSQREIFNTQMMEILGELSNFCKEQIINFLDLESFYYIQGNRITRKGRSRSKEDMKIKDSIDLFTKRKSEHRKFFVCWKCKEFDHFSSRCPKRVRKNRKILLPNQVEEF